MPQSLFPDRTGVRYRIVFFPEAGIESCANGEFANIISEASGPDQAAQITADALQKEYESADWLDPKAGYTQFVEENKLTLSRFEQGEISVAAFNVPFGTIVIG